MEHTNMGKQQQAKHTPFDAQLIEEIAPGLLQQRDELLAALKAIQASFMQDGRLLEGGEWLESDLTQAAFDGMRSAIAKAEGR